METAQVIVALLATHSSDLVGIVLPPVIELLAKDIPPEKETERFLVATSVCLVIAAFLQWNQLVLGNPEAVFTSFGLIFAESQIVFKTYFKNSWFRAKLAPSQQVQAVEDPAPDPLLPTPVG